MGVHMTPELDQLLSKHCLAPPRRDLGEEDCPENWDREESLDIPLYLISQLSKVHLAEIPPLDLQTILYTINMERHRTDIVRNGLIKLSARVKRCMTAVLRPVNQCFWAWLVTLSFVMSQNF